MEVASLNAGKIDKLVVNKDSTNTKKATKVAVELNTMYLQFCPPCDLIKLL